MSKIHWQAVAGFSISLFFLFLAFRNIRLGELWLAVGKVQGQLLAATLPLLLLNYLLFALRWRLILKPLTRLPLPTVLQANLVGLAGNNVLPARMGELLRVFFLSRKTGISRSSILSTVVIERLFDLLALLGLLALVLLYFPFPEWAQYLGGSTAILIALGLGGVVLLTAWEGKIAGWLEIAAQRLPGFKQGRMEHRLRYFNLPLQMLKKPAYTGSILVSSVAIWLVSVGITYVFLHSFSMKVALYQAIFVMVVTQLGTVIPSSPGYVGTYQYLWQLSLGLFGVAKTDALAVSLVYHAYWYIPTTLAGLFILWQEGLSLAKLRGEINSLPQINGSDKKTDE